MISLIIGPMFSGKTTELLRRLNRSKIAGKKVILLRPKIDTRGKLTHDNLTTNGIKEIFLTEINPDDFLDFDVIGIDEGQFFKNLSKSANDLANKGKNVIIAGLDATSELEPFEEIINCIPFSEEVVKLSAICSFCGSEYGSFTHFKSGTKKEKVIVGGSDLYNAICRECLNKFKNQSN